VGEGCDGQALLRLAESVTKYNIWEDLMKAIIGLAMMLLASTAYSETIDVPCKEYVVATGTNMPCDVVPVIKTSREQFERDKAAYEAKKNGDADVAPWNRPEAADNSSSKEQDVNNDCSMPPWKRSPDLKCD